MKRVNSSSINEKLQKIEFILNYLSPVTIGSRQNGGTMITENVIRDPLWIFEISGQMRRKD